MCVYSLAYHETRTVLTGQAAAELQECILFCELIASFFIHCELSFHCRMVTRTKRVPRATFRAEHFRTGQGAAGDRSLRCCTSSNGEAVASGLGK